MNLVQKSFIVHSKHPSRILTSKKFFSYGAKQSIFQSRVLKIVMRIKPGKVLTYKEVARRAGSPRAYRAVGNILNKNYNKNIPCHRVIRSDGSLGGYNRGKDKKKEILKHEGVLGL